MIEEQKLQSNEEKEEQGLQFSIKDIWNMILLHWPWIIVSIILCLGGAYTYLHYQTPTYSASAKMLVKDKDGPRSTNQLNTAELGIISSTNGFDNELEILKSTAISNSVVKALKLNIRYFAQGRVVERELYKASPIIASISDEDNEALKEPAYLSLERQGKGYSVKMTLRKNVPDDPNAKMFKLSSLPGSIETPIGTIHFEQAEGALGLPKDLKIHILPYTYVGRQYSHMLNASPSSKTTTVAVLSIVDTQPHRAVDYLAQLMISYNEDANNDKNEVATKTKEFINDRLDSIGMELSSTEIDLEQFKKQNGLINLANDATTALTNETSYQKSSVEMEVKMHLLKQISDYVSNPANNYQIIPSGLFTSDEMLNAQIKKYNESLLTYNRLVKSGGENNPTIAKLLDEINSTHNAIQQSLRSIATDLKIQKSSIDNQYALFAGKKANTPTQERILNDIGRQQEIKASLYLTLLQKREENLISLASTATKGKWLNEPEIGGQVSPRTQIIWMVALLLGIGLPLGIFYLMEFMRFRIEGRADVEQLTNLPLMADIPFAHIPEGKDRAIVVNENHNNTMEECFRGLRTNMRFLLSQDEKVVLVTSTIPGEGKTFVCTNLAMSFALLGKKVIIVGLDIRKPQFVRLFGLPADKRGITNYLADTTTDYDFLEQQIFHGVKNPNLDVMPAGIIPPNPGELISRKRLDEAIEYLKTKYEIVMFDTPPVGLVSDTLEIGRLADATLFVCRSDYSPKTNFALINGLAEDKKLPNMSIVLNGVDLNKRKYGYYYGYGKYGRYGYHKYGRYGHYGHYGHYGQGGYGGYGGSYGQYGYGYGYGSYGDSDSTGDKVEK